MFFSHVKRLSLAANCLTAIPGEEQNLFPITYPGATAHHASLTALYPTVEEFITLGTVFIFFVPKVSGTHKVVLK